MPPLLPAAHTPKVGREEPAAKARAAEPHPPIDARSPGGTPQPPSPREEAEGAAHLFLHTPTVALSCLWEAELSANNDFNWV